MAPGLYATGIGRHGPKVRKEIFMSDEFYRGLEALGFTDTRARFADAPELRSYDPPKRLRTVLSAVNVGRMGRPPGNEYVVTLQAAAGGELRIIHGEPMRINPEVGSAFGPIVFPMGEALLETLALDGSQLQQWIDHYPIFSFEMKSDDGQQITGVGTRRGLEPTKDVH